jgi:hypothetical protein
LCTARIIPCCGLICRIPGFMMNFSFVSHFFT